MLSKIPDNILGILRAIWIYVLNMSRTIKFFIVLCLRTACSEGSSRLTVARRIICSILYTFENTVTSGIVCVFFVFCSALRNTPIKLVQYGIH